MGLSENLGGVTLLAFGNGSPDIFTSLFNTSGDTELMYTQLLGGATFVTGFVIGIIMIIRPFRVDWKTYFRDVFFFVFAAIFIQNSIHDQLYEMHEGFLTIGIYLSYLTVVIIEHIMLKKKMKKLKESSAASSNESLEYDIRNKIVELEEATEIHIKNRRNSNVMLSEELLNKLETKLGNNPNKGLFSTFLNSINPIHVEDWKKASYLGKFYMIISVSLM